MPIVLSQAEKEMENNEIWIDTICFSHALAHPAKKVFWIQTVLAINAFPSNRDPLGFGLGGILSKHELERKTRVPVWVCTSLRLCAYMFCLYTKQIWQVQHVEYDVPHTWKPCHQQEPKQRTGWLHFWNKQVRAKLQRLLTAKLIQRVF